MLPILGQRRVRRGTGPQSESFMMLGGQHDILGACIAENAGPLFRLPLHALPVKDRGEIVIVVVGPVMLTVIGLRGGAVDAHHVVVPLGIRVVLDVVGIAEVVLGMR